MALQTQVNIYSVDTSAFYDSYERKIHNKMMLLKVKYSKLEDSINKLENRHNKLLKTKLSKINDNTIKKLEREYIYSSQ